MMDHVTLLHGPTDMANFISQSVNHQIGRQAPGEQRFAKTLKGQLGEPKVLIRIDHQVFEIEVKLITSTMR